MHERAGITILHWSMIPKKPAPDLLRGGYRFSACAKLSKGIDTLFYVRRAKAGHKKIMRKQNRKQNSDSS
jgi:hypothetical protein